MEFCFNQKKIKTLFHVGSQLMFLVLQLFPAAAAVLRQIGGQIGGQIGEQMIEEFEALGVKSKANAQEAMDTEAMLGDIPDEFLDPIQVLIYTLLRFGTVMG